MATLKLERKLKMNDCGIPEYMQGGIVRFYENGIPPGHFLTAVIDNDLKAAIERADNTNIKCLKNYIMWFYRYAPSGTWGFKGAVAKYCNEFHAKEKANVSKGETP